MLVITAACSTPAEPTRAIEPITLTFESPDAVARAVIDALNGRDRARLEALALTEQEFRSHVWPELPASRPERNLPFDYVWGQMKQRSDGSMNQIYARYAGRRLQFVQARFTGETTKYESFEVRRSSEIVARDESGTDWVLQLYGSALVKDGRYKVFSFVVDE